MSLLANSADWFKARKTMVRGWYNDGNGRYAFRVDLDGQTFLVCAKKYLNDGKASFMATKIVQRAIDMDAMILLFTSGDRRLVFDPQTVDQNGTHDLAERSDRRRRGEQWVDVDSKLSCSFEDFMEGYDQPPGPTDSPPTDIRNWGAGDD
jgi:hypothetical protein